MYRYRTTASSRSIVNVRNVDPGTSTIKTVTTWLSPLQSQALYQINNTSVCMYEDVVELSLTAQLVFQAKTPKHTAPQTWQVPAFLWIIWKWAEHICVFNSLSDRTGAALKMSEVYLRYTQTIVPVRCGQWNPQWLPTYLMQVVKESGSFDWSRSNW